MASLGSDRSSAKCLAHAVRSALLSVYAPHKPSILAKRWRRPCGSLSTRPSPDVTANRLPVVLGGVVEPVVQVLRHLGPSVLDLMQLSKRQPRRRRER